MLEGRRCRKPKGFLQFLYKRVRVQRVEEVDVTRSAEQNCGRRWMCQGKAYGKSRSGQNETTPPLNGNSPWVTKA